MTLSAGSNVAVAIFPHRTSIAFRCDRASTIGSLSANRRRQWFQSRRGRSVRQLPPPDLLATPSAQVWDSGRIHDICVYRAFLTTVRDEPGAQYHNALQDFGTRDYAFSAKTNGCYGQAAPAVTVTLSHASRINSEDPIPLGQDASMRILHVDGANHPNPNENTLVVRLDLGTNRVLLVGDAPGGPRANPSTPPTVGSIEQVLVTCCASALAAQILVVGHHGSMTSSRAAFLNAIGSTIALVSSGPTQYGFCDPSRSVDRHRAPILRAGLPHRRQRRGLRDQFRQDRPRCRWRAGRCTNIRIVLKDGVLSQVAVWNGS